MSTQSSSGVSEVYAEEGELWLRVSPGHAVSERWLTERAPDLYAQWRAAAGSGARDRLALQIEQRLEDLEATGSRHDAVAQSQDQAATSAVAERVARYEDAAQRLGAIPLKDPGRTAAHRAPGRGRRGARAAGSHAGRREPRAAGAPGATPPTWSRTDRSSKPCPG